MSCKKYYFLNLGCPKNQTDGDLLRGTLNSLGFTEINNPVEANFIVVNTCAFIEQARRETKGEIKELLPYKKNGTKLVVVGCYPVLYDIRDEIPAIDAAFGLNQVDDFLSYVAGKERVRNLMSRFPMVVTIDVATAPSQ
ncbi:MAG: hypothetical protein B6D58_01900 [candidate division Zixibacteria bacterium 4484_95]|nr:MAG: hypothetical protein B6D58_01900 [candidate division Zixibacteria bacterium 4484_95]